MAQDLDGEPVVAAADSLVTTSPVTATSTVANIPGTTGTVAADTQLSVFISYSRRDSLDFTKQLAKALELLGHKPSVDLQGISGGDEWQARLHEMILEADTVIFVLSPESAGSPVCAWEVEEAHRLGKRILPVIGQPLGDAKPPERLQRLNYIHFIADTAVPDSGFGHGLAKLDAALKTDLAWLREHRLLLMRTEAWAARKRDPSRLLSAGLLAETDAWLTTRPATAPDITVIQRAYLDASKAALDKERQEREREFAERVRAIREAEAATKREAEALAAREAERIAREVAQKEAVAQAELAKANAELAKTEAEKAARQAVIVKQRTYAGLAAALMLAAVAGWFYVDADRQRGEAVKSAKVALAEAQRAEKSEDGARKAKEEAQVTQSGLLASVARDTLPKYPETATLLALEAVAGTEAIADGRPYVREAQVNLDAAYRAAEASHRLLTRVEHGGRVNSASFSPDMRLVATASGDLGSNQGEARVFEAVGGKELARVEHSGPVWSAAFNSDGRLVVTASGDLGSNKGEARVFEAKTGKELARVEHGGLVYSAAFSPDSRLVLTKSADKTARVFEAMTGKELARVEHGDSVIGAAFSPDGRLVLTRSNDKTARVFEAAGGKELTRVEHGGPVYSAAFSPDGRLVVTASDDKTARVFEAETGKALARVEHGDSVISAAFSPDGRLVVTRSDDKTARVFEAAGGKELARVEHGGPVYTAAFSPDGRLVVTASDDKTARVFEAAGGKELARVEHGGPVRSAAFSPDGRMVVTASRDKTARVFEAATGKELARVEHGGTVRSAAFSPDGRMVLTASYDKTARLWRAWSSQQHLVNSAVARAPQCLTPAQRKQYFLTPIPLLWCLERKLTPYHMPDWQAWLPLRKAWLASDRSTPEPPMPGSAKPDTASP